jgi:hypothetical protein
MRSSSLCRLKVTCSNPRIKNANEPHERSVKEHELGVHLAKRKHDAAMARTAVLQIEAARDALSAGGLLLFAGFFERQSAIARSVVEQMHGH